MSHGSYRGLAIAACVVLFVSGCGHETKVTRVDAGVVTDLSGRWNDTDSRMVAEGMVKEALELAKAKGTPLSPAMLEGYAAAKVLVEALKRAGKEPTREKVLVALEGMKGYNLGGLEISYSPASHTGLDFADISIISADGRFAR